MRLKGPRPAEPATGTRQSTKAQSGYQRSQDHNRARRAAEGSVAPPDCKRPKDTSPAGLPPPEEASAAAQVDELCRKLEEDASPYQGHPRANKEPPARS